MPEAAFVFSASKKSLFSLNCGLLVIRLAVQQDVFVASLLLTYPTRIIEGSQNESNKKKSMNAVW